MNKPQEELEKIVIAKCIGCGNKKHIKAGEIPKGEQPICDKCFMPMIAERAEIKAQEPATRVRKSESDVCKSDDPASCPCEENCGEEELLK
jgi:hypothetical protein